MADRTTVITSMMDDDQEIANLNVRAFATAALNGNIDPECLSIAMFEVAELIADRIEYATVN